MVQGKPSCFLFSSSNEYVDIPGGYILETSLTALGLRATPVEGLALPECSVPKEWLR